MPGWGPRTNSSLPEYNSTLTLISCSAPHLESHPTQMLLVLKSGSCTSTPVLPFQEPYCTTVLRNSSVMPSSFHKHLPCLHYDTGNTTWTWVCSLLWIEPWNYSIFDFEGGGCLTARKTTASWFIWDFLSFRPEGLTSGNATGSWKCHRVLARLLGTSWVLTNYSLIGWVALYGKIPTGHIPIFSYGLTKTALSSEWHSSLWWSACIIIRQALEKGKGGDY